MSTIACAIWAAQCQQRMVAAGIKRFLAFDALNDAQIVEVRVINARAKVANVRDLVQFQRWIAQLAPQLSFSVDVREWPTRFQLQEYRRRSLR